MQAPPLSARRRGGVTRGIGPCASGTKNSSPRRESHGRSTIWPPTGPRRRTLPPPSPTRSRGSSGNGCGSPTIADWVRPGRSSRRPPPRQRAARRTSSSSLPTTSATAILPATGERPPPRPTSIGSPAKGCGSPTSTSPSPSARRHGRHSSPAAIPTGSALQAPWAQTPATASPPPRRRLPKPSAAAATAPAWWGSGTSATTRPSFPPVTASTNGLGFPIPTTCGPTTRRLRRGAFRRCRCSTASGSSMTTSRRRSKRPSPRGTPSAPSLFSTGRRRTTDRSSST